MENRQTTQNGQLEALFTQLPEDIGRLIAYGDFERAKRVIRLRLEKDILELLRQRLLLELEILDRLPAEYPYSWEEAVREGKKAFRDFTEEELSRLLEEGALEWIYVGGAVRVKNNFVANLIKTREELAPRVLCRDALEAKWENFRLLDQVIGTMKQAEAVRCRFRVRSTLTLHEDKERPGTHIQVQLPVPIVDEQVKAFSLETVSPACGKPAPEKALQRTVCFETAHQAGQKYSVEYTFETKMRYWDWKKAAEQEEAWTQEDVAAQGGNRAGRQTGEAVPESAGNGVAGGGMPGPAAGGVPEEYLAEQLPHIRFTPYLKALVQEVVGEESSPLKRAKRIYDYITTHVMYSFVRSYFTIPQQVEFTALNRKGDCGLQALLFIAMCRIAGIPARWQSGLYATPQSIGCHDWAQFYLEPYGWLYADCSFGGAAYRAGDTERWDFYFGNLDPYRLPAASCYQADFFRKKKYLRSDPYDNQMGEAEYEDAPLLEHRDFDTCHQVLEIKLEAL